MARNDVIGNIKHKSVREILRDGDIDKYWDMSKDEIEVCKDCEYRYACFDCRPVERRTKDVRSRNRYCMYDPYSGEWKSWEVLSARP